MSKYKEIKAAVESLPDLSEDGKLSLAVYIGDPDPDSIGSGMGMAALFASFEKFDKIDIVYSGEISHEQNKTLVNVLNINLHSMQESSSPDEPITSRYTHFVFVDCVPREKWCKDLSPFMVVDHHKETCEEASIEDVRQNCGSCCAIVWEYLSEAKYNFDKDENAKIISTALFFGIQNDTYNFTSDNCSDLDFTAFADLAKHIDRTKLGRIMSYDLPEYFFVVRRYLDQDKNHERLGACYIGFAGFLTEKQRNSMDIIADELVRMEGVDTSIVCGVVGENIQINVRSNNDSLDVDGLCKKIFGKQYGGGKPGAGRVVFPMGAFTINQGSDILKEQGLIFVWEMLKDKIKQILTGK